MFLPQAPAAHSPPSASTEVAPLTVTGVKPGVVTLSCAVKRDRSVERCAVLTAAPANCGFGTAALRLAEHMRLDGQSARQAVRGRVSIPLSFTGVGGCPRPDVP